MEQTNHELKVLPQAMSAEDQESSIDLLELFYHLLDHWKLVAVCAVAAMALMGFATKFLMVPQYEATAKMYVLSSSDSILNLSDIQLGSYLASDYQEVFMTHEVTEQIISNLKLPYTNEELKDMLTVQNPSNTRILNITITSPDPEEAMNIANEYLEVASQYVADVMLTDKPTVLSVALLPEYPVSPSMIKNLFLGAVLGGLAVCAFLIVKFLLDDKVKNGDDITKLTGMPILAEVPVFAIKNTDNKRAGAMPGRNDAL